MANKQYYHPDSDFWRKFNIDAPEATPHGTDEDIRDKMKQLKPNSWHMEGPGILVGQTEMGRLVQNIGTDYILEGTDSQGLPILRKIAT